MSQIRELEDFKDNFNPFTALLEVAGEGKVVDPYVELGRLRRISPIHELDLHEIFGLKKQVTIGNRRTFVVLGYDAVNATLNKPADFLNCIYETNLGITFGKTITAMDGAEHARYRKLFQSAFVPKMLNSLRPRFQAVLDRLIGQFARRGKADLVQELALHFPFQFIMDLMDMPMESRPLFHKIAMAQTCVPFDREHGVQASRMLGDYLGDLINERRALKSETDFVSVIANAEVDGERLPQEVVVSFFRQLMNAGGDTSYHGFSNVLTALFTHPDQLERVRQDRSLVPQTIDEGLRWNGPINDLARTPSHDLELCGVKLPKDAYLHICIGAANRDETIWENPDRFDIFRPVKRHFAFGFGPHICIGQHLARMELTMALNTLLDRLHGLRLDDSMPPPVIRGLSMRGAESVHVVFDKVH